MFLTELIVNRPRDRAAFLRKRSNRLRALAAQVQAAVAMITQEDRSADNGEYLLRYSIGVLHDGDRPMLPSPYQIDLVRHYHIEDLAYSLDSIAQYGPDRFLHYATEWLATAEPLHAETLAFLHQVTGPVEQGFAEYGFKADDQDPELQSAQRMLAAYRSISKALPEIEQTYASLRGVFADMTKRERYAYEPDKYRPDHDPVETLYHASLFASEIVRDGFQAEKPVDRQGVGNLGDQSSISFTHDLRIAHDIMRGLRDMWMIVHGTLTRREIVGWLRAEGIDLKRAESFFMSGKQDPNSTAEVIALYRAYIGLTKLRANPVFVSPRDLIPILRDRPYDDIGIVSCLVRLDGAETSYHYGENEFRVMPSQVVGPVKRVL